MFGICKINVTYCNLGNLVKIKLMRVNVGLYFTGVSGLLYP